MKTFLLCGALATLAFPAAAGARPATDDGALPQVIVDYSDLDLNRSAGAAVMIARVRRAAQSVCRDDLSAGHTQRRRTSACIRSAMTGAFAQLDAPLVTTRAGKAAHHGEFAAR